MSGLDGPAIPATLAPVEREFMLLQGLQALLDAAMESLGHGDAQAVPEISQLITSTARDLSALNPQIAEAGNGRRKLLLDIRQQCAFCRAMLRRWRRSITLHQQLLEMRTQVTSYSGHFSPSQEP